MVPAHLNSSVCNLISMAGEDQDTLKAMDKMLRPDPKDPSLPRRRVRSLRHNSLTCSAGCGLTLKNKNLALTFSTTAIDLVDTSGRCT